MAEDDHDDRRDSNSSSESDFGGLFDEVDPKSSIFYFDRMTIHRNEEDNYTQVIFTYSYMHKYNFESKLYIPSYVPRNLDKIIFSIGMCHLLWYWMGFGTDLIQISNNYSISESTRSFWEVFYNTVTLEFKYLHPSISKITLQNSTQESDPPFIQESSIPLFAYTEQPNYRQGIPITIPPMSVKDKSNSSTSSSSSDDDRVLCPLGGGKDSLVVWKQCIDKECVPVLLYCCDTLYEFEANWRVQKLARRMQSPLFISKLFIYELHSLLTLNIS